MCTAGSVSAGEGTIGSRSSYGAGLELQFHLRQRPWHPLSLPQGVHIVRNLRL